MADDLDLSALRAVAEAATPGPWTVNPNGIVVQLEPPHDSVCDVIESTDADARFIATFHPDRCKQFVDTIEANTESAFERSAALSEAMAERDKANAALTALQDAANVLLPLLADDLADGGEPDGWWTEAVLRARDQIRALLPPARVTGTPLSSFRKEAGMDVVAMEGIDEMCPNCVTPWKCNGPHVTGKEAGE